MHRDRGTNTTVNTDSRGRIESIERPGWKATNFRPDGRAAHIERTRRDGTTMIVNRGKRGDRRIEVVRPGGVRVVAVGRRGFVERPFRRGYVSRTYVIRGRTTVFVYRSYSYRGIAYYRYVPRAYYAPAFYGWAYRPWGVRVVYPWGWGPAPGWFYGGYFAPYPYYADPALWLTDYLLAENLRLAYESQQASNVTPSSSSGSPLTPDQMQVMKQMIAEEVRQQIQAEQAAASQPAAQPAADTTEAAPSALDKNQKTFVVAASLDVPAPNGESCALTGGDIIYRQGELQSDGKVAVTVLSSKLGDCKALSSTTVELVALQDMQNQFHEQVAAGMETLAAKQGQGGMPRSPAANRTEVADLQAPPAPDAQNLLTQLNQEADQTETQIKQATNPATPSAMLRPSVFLCGTFLSPCKDAVVARAHQPCLPPRVFGGCTPAGICS